MIPALVRVKTTPTVPPFGVGASTTFVLPRSSAELSSTRNVTTFAIASPGLRRQTSFPLALRQTKVTPSIVRSFLFALQGAPATIAGAAAEARSPVISHANDATVAERNARREEFCSSFSNLISIRLRRPG